LLPGGTTGCEITVEKGNLPITSFEINRDVLIDILALKGIQSISDPYITQMMYCKLIIDLLEAHQNDNIVSGYTADDGDWPVRNGVWQSNLKMEKQADYSYNANYFVIDVPENTSQLKFIAMNGTGEGSMHTRLNTRSDFLYHEGEYTYSTAIPGSITIDNPQVGKYYVCLATTSSYEGVDLVANLTTVTPILFVTPSNRNVGSSNGSTSFSVSNAGGGTMPWTAQVIDGGSWLSITSGARGTDSGTIQASFTTNSSASSRIGTIRVTASGATGSPKDVTVTQAGTGIQQYTLSASVIGGNGSVTPTGGTYDTGTIVLLTATPINSDYRVKAWSGTDDDSLTSNTNTVTMNDNKNVTVEFELINPDLNGDYFVDINAFAILAQYWLEADCDEQNIWCNNADINHSGSVSIDDLLIMAEHWLSRNYTGIYLCDIPGFVGYIEIDQSGDDAAVYLGYDGPYAGIVNGNVINITLNDEHLVGTMILVFSSDGQTFSGTYDVAPEDTGEFTGFIVDGQYPSDMVFVYINDPGVDDDGDEIPDHEGFTGHMSQYETTNAQYSEFLNAAKAANQITVYNNIVYAASDTSHSQPYFLTYAADSNSQITYSGSTFNFRSRDGYSMANHPVTDVSWYGATAFCNYYGYRLPTEWEWQAVADYDGSYTYGCGTTISKSKANYYDNGYANPLGLTSTPYTSPVGYYPAYGYEMCDMAGNVWEWTSSPYSGGNRVIRGGSWDGGINCSVSFRYGRSPNYPSSDIGFRVCR
jgi:hypothetical protein